MFGTDRGKFDKWKETSGGSLPDRARLPRTFDPRKMFHDAPEPATAAKCFRWVLQTINNAQTRGSCRKILKMGGADNGVTEQRKRKRGQCGVA